MSAKPHQRTLPRGPNDDSNHNHHHDVLIGTGDRTVKLGFLTINVYSLGLYVDPTACRSSLSSDFRGLDHDGLLRQSDRFYPAFVAGKFRKTFRLIFCRTIGRDRLVDAFAGPLRSRVDAAHSADVEALIAHFVPDSGVADDDVLTIVCDADGGTLSAKYYTAATGVEEDLVQISSGGEGGAWMALQNMFFAADTAVPTVRYGAVADLPCVLMEQPADEEEDAEGGGMSVPHMPSEKEIDAAVEESFANAGTMAAKTWSEFAGRDTGRDGYKFGDITLGIVTALGVRKPKPAAKSKSMPLASASSVSDKGKGGEEKDMTAELAALQRRISMLEAVNKKLDSELQRTDDLLVMTEQRLPVLIICALIATELLGLICSCFTNLSATRISFGKLLLFVAVGLILTLAHRHRAEAPKAKTV